MPRLWIFLTALILLPSSQSRAQLATVGVEARERDGSPIRGALVAIMSGSRVVTEGITDSRGFRSLSVPSGRYRVRLRRVGYTPYLSEEITIPYNGTFEIIPDSRRIQLQTVVVSSKSACRRTSDTNGIAAVWEEISKVLVGTQLTRADLTNAGTSVRYEKAVSFGENVTAADTVRTTIAGARPFAAINPSFLATQGYVIGDDDRGWQYFGPDEVILLSNEFADAHCFRIVRDKKRPAQIGLTFEPAPRRRTSDIAGTLWLDEKSSELIELDFHYVNAGSVTRFKPGGFLHFRRMASGAWLVDKWFLRFPQLERHDASPASLVQVGYAEQGGFISSDSDRRPTSGKTWRLRGEIVDSIAHAPLIGATITIGALTTRTASDGSFVFTAVPDGEQTISFLHPSLKALGLVAIERSIDVDSDSTFVRLATPSLSTVWLRICHDSVPDVPVEERGVIHGFVRDNSGQPVADARVEFRWIPYTPTFGERANAPRRTSVVTTDRDGHYVSCGFRRLSVGDVVAVKATAKSSSSSFSFDKSLLIRRDLVFQ
jgi:hypothetical protein